MTCMRIRVINHATLLSVLASLAGCSPVTIRDPMPTCLVVRTNQAVIFSRRLPQLTHDLPIGELEVWRFKGGAPRLLWRIEGQRGELVSRIAYGTLPEGYVQILPAKGVPESLREGDEYAVSCDDGLGAFRLTGDGVENLEP